MRKLKKGSGKYKGKLHFKFFKLWKSRTFVAECPHAKNQTSDDEDPNIKKGANIINTKRATIKIKMKRKRTSVCTAREIIGSL